MPSTSVELQIIDLWRQFLAPHSIGYRIKLLSQLLVRKFQERLGWSKVVGQDS